MADRIFIVRHGETEWSANGKHTSVTDLPLTENGRRQAAIAAEKLKGEHLELVLCSPLLRARQTAEIAGLGETAGICDDLVEWKYGEYEGLTSPEIWERHDPNWNLWRDGCPGGEQAADVGYRADALLASLPAHGDQLAFSHGHLLRVLTARWLGLPAQDGALVVLAPGSVGVLGYEHGRRVLRGLS